jgi:hypothetical protein
MIWNLPEIKKSVRTKIWSKVGHSHLYYIRIKWRKVLGHQNCRKDHKWRDRIEGLTSNARVKWRKDGSDGSPQTILIQSIEHFTCTGISIRKRARNPWEPKMIFYRTEQIGSSIALCSLPIVQICVGLQM